MKNSDLSANTQEACHNKHHKSDPGNGEPTQRRLKARKLWTSLALQSTALVPFILFATPTSASCSNNNQTTTCTGDPFPYYADIAGGRSDPYTFYFQNFSTAPSDKNSSAVIYIESTGSHGNDNGDDGTQGRSLDLFYDGGSYTLDSGSTSFQVYSRGGSGHDGKDRSGTSGISGGEGGDGGRGGDIHFDWKRGNITALGPMEFSSYGGASGEGGKGHATTGNAHGDDAGDGGAGGAVSLVFGSSSAVVYSGGFILASSFGGVGETGGPAHADLGEATGQDGGTGGKGGNVTIDFANDFSFVQNPNAYPIGGIYAHSDGADGGDGGKAGGDVGSSKAGDAGRGGDGGNVAIRSNGHETSFLVSGGTSAVYAYSSGGAGGDGGNGDNSLGDAKGGDGGSGGAGGDVNIELEISEAGLTTSWKEVQGIFAQSLGGSGGDGGSGSGGLGSGKGGGGALAGNGGQIDINLTGGFIETQYEEANGIIAQSVGGFAGNAGGSSGFVAYGADAQSGGSGGPVAVTIGTGFVIRTLGDSSAGIIAQSVGGGGGRGGSSSGLTSMGGIGSSGGSGDRVTVTTQTNSSITTLGESSFAIEAQSIGGSGGSAGASKGLVSMGGNAGSGGSGGTVTVNNEASLSTSGDYADAIVAQSIGGGGGNAHSTAGMSSIGGSGGDGGDGGKVIVNNAGPTIKTTGVDADAVVIQSIGGGGGSGSNAIATGAEFSTAIGGQGGAGGSGGEVDYVETNFGRIVTEGDYATGVLLQSIGGGGGDGGYAVSASAGVGFDMSIGAGGSGSHGGAGGLVYAQLSSSIETHGDHAVGLQAQSIGGGGGNGGMAISSANTNGVAASTAVGGSGGNGGSGDQVLVLSEQAISTFGDASAAIMAQSIGGGGGSSGLTIDANAVSNMSTALSIGRSGGSGGNGGEVYVTTLQRILTEGASSDGILAQSIGGSGGNASAIVAASGSAETGSLNVAVGGAGGAGGNANTVYVRTYQSVSTLGPGSNGIVAQSIGGSGGNGSLSIAGTLTSNNAIDLSIGGSGGGGGHASDIEVDAGYIINTQGDNSIGILAQSIGGSGGNGGMSIAAAAMAGNTANVSVSGSGGNGNTSGDVLVNLTSHIATSGQYATAIKAMSIAGGGGNATAAITGATSQMGEAGVTLGGGGGGGGDAGDVTVNLDLGGIITNGDYSDGIWAGSIGGGGGHGAIAAQGSLSGGQYASTNNVTIGGTGGNGGTAGDVAVTTSDYEDGHIETYGYQSRGIYVSSIGGSGGMGGSAYSGNLVFSEDVGMTVGVNVGGAGGAGGIGGNVNISSRYDISTLGDYSDGIFAQSIGGDGGAGGNAVVFAGQAAKSSSLNFAVAVGGTGGTGAHAGNVDVYNGGALKMSGLESHGIYAQSVGGGGGRGGNAGTVLMDATASQKDTSEKNITMNVGVQVGGTGGNGGDGKAVSVTNDGEISVGYQEYQSGELVDSRTAFGIFAQSVGGGGGDGGSVSGYLFSVSGDCTASGLKNYAYQCEDTSGVKSNYAPTLQSAIGGNGANAGDGNSVNVNNNGSIETRGTGSHAIYAQSVGGGGGTGGYGALGSTRAIAPNATVTDLAASLKQATLQYSNTRQFQTVNIIVGGQGGSGGNGGNVTINNTGNIITNGETADGIYAQSVGGGGGDGGTALSGLGQWIQASVGGAGSGGGHGGDVSIDSSGYIMTKNDDAMGIFAQSVGGGGGRAGAVTRTLEGVLGVDLNVGKGVGAMQKAGDGGNAGDININIAAGSGIVTTGDYAHGIFAQSIGGGGGSAHIEGVENEAFSFAGGVGDDGNGGDINITIDSPITVSGIGAHALFAQSTSGNVDDGALGVSSGDVTININSDILASGKDGRGLLVQSDGLEKTGQIYVTISEHGSVSTNIDGGDTIALAHGQDNVIENYGLITKQEDASSANFALRTDASALTVHNHGTFMGSVQLAAIDDDLFLTPLTNVFYNEQSARLGLGMVFDLGDLSSSLHNNGRMTAGEFGSIGATSLTGQFIQSATGTLFVDHNFDGDSDEINLQDGGSATLAGLILPNPVETVPADNTSGGISILTAPDGISAQGLSVQDTATVDYTLHYVHGSVTDELVLGYSVDYAGQLSSVPPSPSYGENFYKVADYIGHLAELRRREYEDGGSEFEFVDDFIFKLLKVPTIDELATIYRHLTPDDLHRNAEAHLRSSQQFSNSLMSCPDLSGANLYAFQVEGSCMWSQVSASTRTIDESQNNIDYEEDTWRFSSGIQFELRDDWFLGGAFAIENADTSTAISKGAINRFHVGAVLKQEIGNTNYAVSLSAGRSESEITREGLAGFGAPSDSFDTSDIWVAAHGRLSHVFKWQDGSYFEPYADAGVTWLDGKRTTFAGALPIDLAIQSSDVTQYSAAAGFSFGRAIETEKALLDMGVDFSVLSIFDSDFSSRVGFAASPDTSITLSSQGEDLLFDLGAHISAQIGEKSSLKLNVGAQIDENETGYGADFRFSHQF